MNSPVEKKKRGTSIPLLLGIVGLGVIGYLAGPTIMTWFFYLEENKKGTRPAEFAYAGPDDPSPPPEGSRGGGGGGNQDPEALFAERDKDSDGKLAGDEISERMQARLEEIDTDKDSAVSKEEFVTAWKNRQSAQPAAGGKRPLGAGTGPAPAEATAPATEQPAAPKTEEPAAPKAEEPAAPKAEEPAAPKAEEPAVPKAE